MKFINSIILAGVVGSVIARPNPSGEKNEVDQFLVKKGTSGDPHKFVADTTIIPAPENVNATVSSYGWVEYNQCDSRWAYQQLGWCEGFNICHYGCAMSSAAMLLATRGVSVDPSSLDIYLSDNGGYVDGCDLIWGRIDDFGVSAFQGMETADESSICWGLSQGHGIIANVRGGSHWVLLTACLGNGVFAVNDPGFDQSTYSIWDIVMEAVYW